MMMEVMDKKNSQEIKIHKIIKMRTKIQTTSNHNNHKVGLHNQMKLSLHKQIEISQHQLPKVLIIEIMIMMM